MRYGFRGNLGRGIHFRQRNYFSANRFQDGRQYMTFWGSLQKGLNSDIMTKNPELYPAFSDSAQKITLILTLKIFVGQVGRIQLWIFSPYVRIRTFFEMTPQNGHFRT